MYIVFYVWFPELFHFPHVTHPLCIKVEIKVNESVVLQYVLFWSFVEMQLSPKHNQLYSTLLREYEDTRLQLAEARLHIDRMRFGRNVDLHRQYVIRHLHNKADGGNGPSTANDFNSNAGSFVHAAATISALSMSTPALPAAGGGRHNLHTGSTSGSATEIPALQQVKSPHGVWCSDPQIALMDKETQYSLSTSSVKPRDKIDIADASALSSSLWTGRCRGEQATDTGDHKQVTSTSRAVCSVPSGILTDCSAQEDGTTVFSMAASRPKMATKCNNSNKGFSVKNFTPNMTSNNDDSLSGLSSMEENFDSCSLKENLHDNSFETARNIKTNTSKDRVHTDLPTLQHSVNSDDIRAWLNEKWSGSATGVSAPSSINDIENSSKVLFNLRQQVKALTEHVLNNDESIEYLYNEILNIQYDHRRLAHLLSEALKNEDDLKLALHDQVTSISSRCNYDKSDNYLVSLF